MYLWIGVVRFFKYFFNIFFEFSYCRIVIGFVDFKWDKRSKFGFFVY